MSFADPFRWRVMKRLIETVETVTPANGYLDNLTGSVFTGRAFFGENDPIPMVSFIEAPLPADYMSSPWASSDRAGEWNIFAQGWAKDDPKNPTHPAYVLCAQVCHAFAKAYGEADAHGFHKADLLGEGRSVYSFQIGAPVVRPADEISTRAYFWLPLCLKVAEDLLNP